MSAFATMTAAGIADAVRAGKVRAASVVRDALDRIERIDGTVNACTATFADEALAAADAVDATVAAGRDPGPMAGVPVAVKNLFDMAGRVTLAGAHMLRDAPPAVQDATAVRRLRDAGAIMVAATNMDEFAYGFTTENEFYGVTRNPRDTNRLAGGSSGGSAAAVAAGMAHIGLGSDTNGSIRIPAAFSGVFGLKPTFGRLSRAGTIPFVASLDHIGPMARRVDDLALAYDAMQGADARDPACTVRAVDPVRPFLSENTPLRVGVLGGWFRADADAAVLAAVDAAAEMLRAATTRVELAEARIARFAAFAITAAEGANLHRRALCERPEDFDGATRDRLLAGALLPAGLVIQAQRFRRRFQETVRAAFADHDVLIAPATPCVALERDRQMLTIGGREMPARAHIGIYTQPLSYVGLPVLVAPIVLGDAFPVGIQLVAAPWAERALFRAAARLEAAGLAHAGVAEPA